MAVNSITTGQYVNLRQTAASAGDRIIAQLIDLGVQIVYLIAFLIILVNYGDKIEELLGNDRAKLLCLLALFLPPALYAVMVESLTGGLTLGKYVMHTRVVMADGSMPGLGAYLLRWLLLPIDLLFNLGLIFILFSPRSQRLGDMTAGTMVVKINGSRTSMADLNTFNYVGFNYVSHGYR